MIPCLIRTFGAGAALLLTFSSARAGGPLPSGGVVVGGSATIGAPAGNALTVQQQSQRAIVNWSQFGVGQGNKVTFSQPNSQAAILNRVTGNDSTAIAGQLNSNGSVYVVNQNGVQITPTGQINANGGFVASTLDISNGDFMAGNNHFSGNGGAVVNRGTIKTGPGGSVALIGSTAANAGVIDAPVGQVGLGSAAEATLDVNGDGFLQVILPAATKDADGHPLVSNSGKIRATGGTVELKAATVAGAMRDAVRMSGSIEARSVSGHDGSVVLGGGDGPVEVSGNIDVSARPGALQGGTVSVTSAGPVSIRGRIKANGGGKGGHIDVTGSTVTLTGADISATGTEQGGLVRIGGPFQGGKPQIAGSPDTEIYAGRFGPVPTLAIADSTTVDAGSKIDVSATGAAGVGGTTIVWSNQATVMDGRILATGTGSGGAVEISSKSTIQSIALGNVNVGVGGTLLLDPQDILIDSFGTDTTQNIAYDTSSTTTHLLDTDVTAFLSTGASLTLQASEDITWSQNSVTNVVTHPGGNPNLPGGNLTLQAGRSVTMFNGVYNSADGNWTIIANDTVADGVSDGNRGAGAAVIDTSFSAFIMGAGTLNMQVLAGTGLTNNTTTGMIVGNVRGHAFSASIDPAAVSGSSVPPLIQISDNIDVSTTVTLTGNLNIDGVDGNEDTMVVSGTTVDWTNEAPGASLTATSGAIITTTLAGIVEFVENGVLTRYGIISNRVTDPGPPDATRLSLGNNPIGSFTRVYGDNDPAVSDLTGPLINITSGTERNPLSGMLHSGSLTVTGPGATASVGSSNLVLGPSGTFTLNDGYQGFVNTTAVNIPLAITARTITPVVGNGTYTYGAPAAVVTLNNVVNNDAISAVATLDGTTGVTMAVNGGGYGFDPQTGAGSHNFALTGISGAAASNYTIDLSGTVSGSLAIAQKPLTFTAGTTTQPYGVGCCVPVTLNGIVGSDDVSGVVGLTLTGNPVTFAANTPVGTYVATVTGLNGTAAGNYVLATSGNNNGSYTVTPAVVTYSLGNDTSTYGTLATLSLTLGNTLPADNISGTIALGQSGNPVALSATLVPGLYSDTVSGLTGPGVANYTLATSGNTDGTLTIGRKTLTATGGSGTVAYASAMPAAVLTGIVGGDQVVGTQNVIPFGGGFSDSGNYAVGSYQLQVTGLSGANASNYTLGATTAGSVTVTALPVTYQFGSISGTYGTAVGLPSAQIPGIVTNDRVVSTTVATGPGGAVGGTSRSPAGTYTLTVSNIAGPDAGNYTIATSGNTPGTLTIAPLPIAWSVADTQATYGNTPSYSATLNGTLLFDDVTPVVTAAGTGGLVTTATGVGTYTSSVTSLSGTAAGNYTLAGSGNTTGTLTIVPRPVTFSVANASGNYGTLATPGAATISNLVNGDTINGTVQVLSGSTPVALAARTSAGSYVETVSGITGAAVANYTIATSGNTNGTLTIAPLPVTFTTTDASSTYGTAATPGPGTLSGVLPGDAVTPNATAIQGGGVPGPQQAVGSYSLVVPSLSGAQAGDYTLATAGSTLGTLTIAPKSLTYSIAVEWGGRSTSSTQLYGNLFGTPPVGVGSLTGVVGTDQVTLALSSPTVPLSSAGFYGAGTYTWTGTGLTGAAAGNYTLATAGNSDGVLTITPVPLAAFSFAQQFNPLFGFTISISEATYGSTGGVTVGTTLNQTSVGFGVRQGDAVSASGAFVINGNNVSALAANLPVGTYQTTVGGLTGADAGNYTIVSTSPQSLTVVPKQISAQVGDSSSTYGTLAALGSVSLSGVLSGDQVTADAPVVHDPHGNLFTLGPRTPAGFYNMAVESISGADAGNYQLVQVAEFTPSGVTGIGVAPQNTTLPQSRYGALNISPITLGLSLDTSTLTQIYGSLVPAPQLTGVLSGDSAAVNYVATTISSVTDPSGHSTKSPTGLLDVGTYTLSTSALFGSQAGDYVLPFAAGSSLGTITIKPKTVTASVADTITTYGTLATPAVTLTGVLPGQTLGTTITTTDPGGNIITYTDTTNFGSYTQSVTAISGTTAADYALSTHGTSGRLSILRKVLTLSVLSDATGTYGSPIQIGTLTGIVAGDDVGIDTTATQGIFAVHMTPDSSGALYYPALSNAGSYSVFPRSTLTGTRADNYTLSGSGTSIPFLFQMDIAPKPVTYTVDNATVQYGGFLQCESGTNCYEWTPGGKTGTVHLNGIVAGDSVNAPVSLLDLLGDFSTYGPTTVAGQYFETVTGLSGLQAANYTIAKTGSVPGILTVEPAWVTYSTSSAIFLAGSGLFGTPGLLNAIYTGANGATGTVGTGGTATLLNGDVVGVVGTIYDPRGNVVVNLDTLIPGDYLFPVTSFVGGGSGNYRPVMLANEFAPGPHSTIDVGTLSVFADSTLGLGLVTNTKTPLPPAPPQSTLTPPNALMTGEQAAVFGHMFQNGVSTTPTGTATSTSQTDVSIGTSGVASGNAQQTTSTGGVTLGAQEDAITQGLASAGIGGVSVQANASGNVNVSVTSGPGFAAVGAQAQAQSTVTLGALSINPEALNVQDFVKLVNLEVSNQAATGAYAQGGANGGLGVVGSGSVDGTVGVFASATSTVKVSLVNGELNVSNMVGSGATAGVNGGLSGSNGSIDTGVTVYSPGAVGEQLQVNGSYSNGTLSLGLNLGAEIGIAGIDLNLNVSININNATDSLASIGAKMLGVPPPASSSSCAINCVVNAAAGYNMTTDPAGLYKYLASNNFSGQQYYGDNPTEYQSLLTFYNKYQSLATSTQSVLKSEQDVQTQMLSLLKTDPAAAIALAHSGQIKSLQIQEVQVGFQAHEMGVNLAVQNNALTFVDRPQP